MSKVLYLRSLTWFWICPCCSKNVLTFRVALRYIFCETFRTQSLIVNSDKFMSYSDIFSHVVAYVEPCITLAYSEPCHIQNAGIFRTRDIFRTQSRHVLVYSEHYVTLAYWEPCDIQNSTIFRLLAYSEPYQTSKMEHLMK